MLHADLSTFNITRDKHFNCIAGWILLDVPSMHGMAATQSHKETTHDLGPDLISATFGIK